LLRGVDRGEFLCKIGEIGKSEFARVGFVTNAEKADRVSDDVAVDPRSVT
jgi:hypothetical protein